MTIQNNSIALPLPSAELLTERESCWRVTLPNDYRNFIMKFNGGIPTECAFFPPNSRERNIERFLCILENYQDHPLGWYDIDVVDAQIGEYLTDTPDELGVGLLPIADLFFGNYLCLDFRKSRVNPTVCIWDHEGADVFSPAPFQVANNFTEFLRMLTLPEE